MHIAGEGPWRNKVAVAVAVDVDRARVRARARARAAVVVKGGRLGDREKMGQGGGGGRNKANPINKADGGRET